MANRNVILVEPAHRDNLKPFTWARPICSIRMGILTIQEKWERHLDASVSYKVPEYLKAKYPCQIQSENIIIQAHVIPTRDLVAAIHNLIPGEFLLKDNEWIAGNLSQQACIDFLESPDTFPKKTFPVDSLRIRELKNLWEIFQWNDSELELDFDLVCNGRKSQTADDSNKIIGNRLFIEEGARLSCSTINAQTGPVYLASHSEVMEGCMIRGGLALLEHAQLKMGAKIYGATTIGPASRVGGELNNVIIQANSNKAHDGFLGNSVIGEWCNLGADSNNSNLKNNYEVVKIWSYPEARFISTNSIFCGLMMGDHAKCGINTMFNTATVVGYGANVFGDGFPRQFIPEFAWGGASGFSTFNLNKFFQTADTVMQRRDQNLTELDRSIAQAIFAMSQNSRSWEKSSD